MISIRTCAFAFTVFLFVAGTSLGQCPSISVIGPSGITNAGDEMKFRVEVGVVGPRLKYLWTLDQGIIVRGQGTPAITVITDKSGADQVKATVEIEGLRSDCEKKASETAPIAQSPPWCWDLDSWGILEPNDESARLDSFFAELMNNPDNVGLIVLRMTHKERLDSENRRVRFVLKHARFRKFDRTRLWFALELAENQKTTVVRIPPGGEMPCDKCLIIKGGDL